MAAFIYSALTSLDGYVADEHGNFDWAMPDDEVHTAVNNLSRPIGTYLYGRRIYEVLAVWETMHTLPEPILQDYARIWQAADKIVYSRTLQTVTTARTRLEHTFDPEAIRQLKASATSDIAIAGPTLAAHALRAGLVDEIQQFLAPVIVGGGTPFFPHGIRLDLELRDERRFGNGMAFLHYRTRA